MYIVVEFVRGLYADIIQLEVQALPLEDKLLSGILLRVDATLELGTHNRV